MIFISDAKTNSQFPRVSQRVFIQTADPPASDGRGGRRKKRVHDKRKASRLKKNVTDC